MPSAEAYERSLAQRVSLNGAVLTNKYWYLPVDGEGHEDFEPVGRGVQSSDFCGKWMHLTVCRNFEGHKAYGERKVVVRHKHAWCHKATCCVCFIRGWSVRGARNIANRLDKYVERGSSVG